MSKAYVVTYKYTPSITYTALIKHVSSKNEAADKFDRMFNYRFDIVSIVDQQERV